VRLPAKILHKYVHLGGLSRIPIVSLLSGSAAAWTHVTNATKKEMAGEKFIWVEEWSRLEPRIVQQAIYIEL
jgi:hypothetical protein